MNRKRGQEIFHLVAMIGFVGSLNLIDRAYPPPADTAGEPPAHR